jgi:WD40 repeat protein
MNWQEFIKQQADINNLSFEDKTGRYEKYFQILTDYNFISAKIHHPEFGVQALIEDYDLLDDTQTNLEQTKTLKYIQSALRLSAHIVNQDKQQLASQLWGRLSGIKIPEIQELLTQAKQTLIHPWLRPLSPSLQLVTYPNVKVDSNNCWLTALEVTVDGKKVISGSSEHTVKIWNLETTEELLTLEGHYGSINTVAITVDGKKVISGSDDQNIRQWNLETGEELLTLQGHHGSVNTLAVTRDGNRLISGGGDQTIKVWNLETGEELLTLIGHQGSVNTLAVTNDEKWVISGSWDDTVKIWNLETGKEQLTLIGHTRWVRAVAVTTDGKRIISTSLDHTLKVWNLQTGEVIATFTGEGYILSCAVAPDDLTIVAGDSSGMVHFLKLENAGE